MKTFLSMTVTAALFLLITAVVSAQREPMPNDPSRQSKPVVAPDKESDGRPKRIREGTAFRNRRVFFRQTGRRTTLYDVDGKERYLCLENLNLERILKAIEEQPARGIWTIDGVFTEFQGENYVLIQRAVVTPTDFMPAGEASAGK